MSQPSKPSTARPVAPRPGVGTRSPKRHQPRTNAETKGCVRGTNEELGALRPAHIPSRAEREERRQVIYQLLNAGADRVTMHRAMAERFNMRPDLVDSLVSAVKHERAEQFEADRPKYKAEQVARLQADLVRMRSKDNRPWGAISRHEQLLARVVGTIEPVAVAITGTINVREALVAVVQHLDADTIDELVLEQMELRARADAAHLLMPTSSRTVLNTATDDRSSVDPTRRPS